MDYKLEFKTAGDHQHRSVAFLVSRDIRNNIKAGFNSLDKNRKRHFYKRFDTWVSGKPYPDWYHRWDKSEFNGRFTMCFVFEIKATGDRLYGFLCNPKQSNRGYQLCVLVSHKEKFTYKTNIRNLENVEEIRLSLEVRKAIDDHYKDKEKKNEGPLDRTKS